MELLMPIHKWVIKLVTAEFPGALGTSTGVPHSDKGKGKCGGCTAQRDVQQLNITAWMFTHWHECILKRVFSEGK